MLVYWFSSTLIMKDKNCHNIKDPLGDKLISFNKVDKKWQILNYVVEMTNGVSPTNSLYLLS